MFILINYNHPICRNKELIENYKYDFIGKEIVRNIILENEVVFVLYEPDEFILELEKLERAEPKPSKPRPREKGEADPFRKNCPECGGIAMECQCEGVEECKFCKTGEPFPIACSCQSKNEEEEPEEESVDLSDCLENLIRFLNDLSKSIQYEQQVALPLSIIFAYFAICE